MRGQFEIEMLSASKLYWRSPKLRGVRYCDRYPLFQVVLPRIQTSNWQNYLRKRPQGEGSCAVQMREYKFYWKAFRQWSQGYLRHHHFPLRCRKAHFPKQFFYRQKSFARDRTPLFANDREWPT